ncbi:aspartic proteinase CDR1-like [Pyrus communis]|uniref:aspartic proteinase CDR1-like n=1 Tax=Pyrus communis TaxID=23211 RepID=UPI0035BFC541
MDAYGEEGGNVAGILGLGWSPHSLVSQLGSISEGQFSHCLQRMPYDHHSPNTYLRFGADIPNRPSFQQTELAKFGRLIPYFLNMLDISVARLIQPAYEILERALVNYFSRYRNITRIHREDFNLCYQRSTVRREGFMNLPTITFHLRGADLLLQPQAAFLVDLTGRSYRREYFCLAMFNESDDTVIGAYQQTNQRFIYDPGRRTLRFGPEDCSRTP